MRPVRATLELGGAPLTLLPRRAPVGNSGPVRGRPLTVLPLNCPLAVPLDGGPADLSAGSERERLLAVLPRPDAALLPAVLQPGDTPGVALFDLTTDEALAVGQALGVAAFLHWDGRRAVVLP